jgi:hypothetical protein
MNWPLVIAGGMSLVGAEIHGIVGDLFPTKGRGATIQGRWVHTHALGKSTNRHDFSSNLGAVKPGQQSKLVDR